MSVNYQPAKIVKSLEIILSSGLDNPLSLEWDVFFFWVLVEVHVGSSGAEAVANG